MEDQGKRLLLAVVIAFGIMMLWTVLFPPEKKEEKPTAPVAEEPGGAAGEPASATAAGQASAADGAAEAGNGAAGSGGAGAESGSGSGAANAEAAQRKLRGEEQLYTFEFNQFKAVFSSYSGAIKSWELLGEKYRDRSAGGKRQTDMAPTGNPVLFAPDDVAVDLYPFLVGFDTSSDHQVPGKTEWSVTRQTDTAIDFTWSSADLRLVKKYRLFPDDYLVELTVDIEKISGGEAKQTLMLSSFAFQDPSQGGGSTWTRVETRWKTACYVDGELRDNSSGYLSRGQQRYSGRVQWSGFAHSYFLAAFAPRTEMDGQLACVASVVPDAPAGTMRVDLLFGPPAKLRRGKLYSRTVTAYLGPKYLGKLDSISEIAGYDTGFAKSIDLGFFGFISRPLLWLLGWFQSFVINWGIAIILLTIVVKLATLYWTTKSMRSMKAMATLKPEVEKIQKKYKDDKQRQQVEIMAMYKAHKVSPLSGCLPMLLQMPIWFALYRTLMVAAELYQAPFIPGWIDDLTAPDPVYVLPIALTGMMFLQAKLSPSVADSTQQKVMMYGLPLMFGGFSLFFPSGLTLYIFTNTCLTALHHVWMNRTDKEAEAQAAKDEPKSDDAGDDAGSEVAQQDEAKRSGDESARGAQGDGEGKQAGPRRAGTQGSGGVRGGKAQRTRKRPTARRKAGKRKRSA